MECTGYLWNSSFHFRIFNLLSKIYSGTIFALLPPNTVFMAISLYTTEHVATYLYFHFKFLKFHVFIFFSLFLFFILGRPWLFPYSGWCSFVCVFTLLAIPLLPFCHLHLRTSFFNQSYGIRVKLVHLSAEMAKISHFGDCSFTTECSIHRI